jgi:hypothetical protein
MSSETGDAGSGTVMSMDWRIVKFPLTTLRSISALCVPYDAPSPFGESYCQNVHAGKTPVGGFQI